MGKLLRVCGKCGKNIYQDDNWGEIGHTFKCPDNPMSPPPAPDPTKRDR